MNVRHFPISDRPARRRVLVVANDAAGPGDAQALIGGAPVSEVLVVAPALNSWSGRLVCDAAAAEHDACERLESTVRVLRRAGVSASGIVGDADPLLALEDALSVFHADEVVIATVAERIDGWLGETLAARARAHCGVPVWNVAVHPAAPAWHEPLVAA